MTMWMAEWPAITLVAAGALIWLASLTTAAVIFAQWMAGALTRLDASEDNLRRARAQIAQAHAISAAYAERHERARAMSGRP
ncbi:MAG TPA: hypothetical protein VF808_08175 [Ktedonobacterales bacterium]